MKFIAEFEKVSFDQFKKAMMDVIADNLGAMNTVSTDEYLDFVKECYDAIKLPKRGSKGSAGYDFTTPFGFFVRPGDSIVVPTGIRCKIDGSWMLSIYPRSGMGFKTHARLANTVGIIDSDYYYANNEGHIMVKLVAADKPIDVNIGDRFCQGIFTEYGLTVDDDCEEIRTGGFGSTGA